MTNLLIKLFIKNTSDIKCDQTRSKYGSFAAFVGLILNIVLALTKILVGLIFGSLAIMADGLNNLSDAASGIVALFGFKLACLPADKEHPFGHARYEYLSGLIIAIIIIFISLQLGKSSFDKIIAKEVTTYNYIAIGLLGLSIAIKLWMCRFYLKISKLINSTSLKAASIDSRNDCIATLVILLCGIFTMFTKISLDGYAGLAVSAFVMISGIKILKETLSPLLGEAPNKELVAELCSKISKYDNVLGIHDVIFHNYGANKYFASVHVEVDYKEDIMISHELIDTIERELSSPSLSLVIHLDPIVTDDEEINNLKKLTQHIIHSIDPRLSFHDFRVVLGNRKNLIFDLVVPSDFKIGEQALLALVKEEINTADETCFAVINLDRSFVGEIH